MIVQALALAAACAAIAVQSPAEPAESRSSSAPDESFGFWVGKSADDLRTAFGEARKTRRSTDSHVVLTYRLDVLCGEPMFAARPTQADRGVGPEYGPPESDPGSKVGPLDPTRADKRVAKRFFIDFRVDEAGLIEGYRLKRVKHKKCPSP